MIDPDNDFDFSDSELEEFFKENERLLIEENESSKMVDQCYCGVASTSTKVIRCDNEVCNRQWFHQECVGLKEEPEGEWFCSLKCIELSAVSSAAQTRKEVEGMVATSTQSTAASSSTTDSRSKKSKTDSGSKKSKTDSGSKKSKTDSGSKKISRKVQSKYPAPRKIEKKDVIDAVHEFLDAALTKIGDSYIFKMKTSLSSIVQDLTSQLKEQKEHTAVIVFSTELVAQLWEIINSVRGKNWSEEYKQKMWQQFHALRCEVSLKEHWHRVLLELAISKEKDAEVFLFQVLIKEIFGCLLNFTMEKDLPPKDHTPSSIVLDTNEENALRYACGYVPHKLKKRFRRMPGNDIAAKFADVLDSWDDSEVYGDSFLNYTKEWLKLQNRGGLFKVNDDVFLFFRAVELVVRSVLYLKNMSFIQSCDIQQVLLSEMVKDERVVSRWMKIVPQLVGQLRQKLFEDVLKCYTKMRCEAFVKVYLMLLKEKQSQLSRRSEKSLRKELQK